jgi:uncharacterized protein (TIGR02246 family)
MKPKVYLMAAGAALVALVAFLITQVPTTAQTQPVGPDRQPAKDAGGGDTKRPDDEAAIRKSAADFIKAAEKGDAKAVASFWTEHGEYIDEDGTTLRGRAAIEAAYAKAFAKVKSLKIEITIESIRFPSKDTAIEEGYAKTFRGGSEHPTTSRYSVLHVREGGKWLMALLREWPDEGMALRDLDWLIGTWEAKTEDAEVHTTYTWDANKNSIRCQFTIKTPLKIINGTQIILKDPRNGQLRSWIFDDEGGFGDGTWMRDGKRWVIEASGVQYDGSEVTATNILTPVDADSFSWQSIQRTLDDEELPNIAPIKIKRVKK